MKHTLKPSMTHADGQTTINLPFLIRHGEIMRKNTSWTPNETAAAKGLLGLGMSTAEIAERLFRTEGAVTSHFSQIGLRYTMNTRGEYVYSTPPDPSFGLVLVDAATKCEAPTAIDPTRPTPHHHAKLIVAWAKGHKLQVKSDCNGWADTERPEFLPSCSYRIKPGPMPTPEELADAILDVSAGRQIGSDLKYRLEMARVDVVSWSVAEKARREAEAANGFAAP